ncbi:MAG: nitrilase [Gammaproteobacteria bacterium]|jgi:nitrilase
MSEQSYKVAVVQAAPVFMNLEATIDKGIAMIEQASKQGARLIAFPECWVPGYPWWAWLSAPAHNLKYFGAYHENSLSVDSPAFERLCSAAKANRIFVSMGASERDHGSLYMAQFLIDDSGVLIKARRKLKPTFVERTVFGEGDGSDLEVSQTSLGRIGQLNCWEHLQPLTKYALFSLHEQVHVGAWPSFSCYPQAYSLGAELNTSASRVYAAEGQCFVLAACAVISPEMVALLAETTEHHELIAAGGGHSRIFGPDGSALCEPLAEDEEGILYADIDLGQISIAKCFADPVGHYARPDVTQLLLNRTATRPVQERDTQYLEVKSEPDLPISAAPRENNS